MNKEIIEMILKDYSNTEKRIIAKEYLIRSEDTEFVDRLNATLKYAMKHKECREAQSAEKHLERI